MNEHYGEIFRDLPILQAVQIPALSHLRYRLKCCMPLRFSVKQNINQCRNRVRNIAKAELFATVICKHNALIFAALTISFAHFLSSLILTPPSVGQGRAILHSYRTFQHSKQQVFRLNAYFVRMHCRHRSDRDSRGRFRKCYFYR